MPRKVSAVCLSLLLFGLSACGGGNNAGNGGGTGGGGTAKTPIPGAFVDGCFLEDYPDPATSDYILPYQVGTAFNLSQGNCGVSTHKPQCNTNGTPCGDIRYAYDHNTPIGIVVLAARGGTVVSAVDNFPNGTNDYAQNNYISIRHVDGTFGRYLHLNQDSLMVQVGQDVAQGDPIALSGDSGNTGPNPHIHFDVVEERSQTCILGGDFSGCRTLPISFRNAAPMDAPLVSNGTSYLAEPF